MERGRPEPPEIKDPELAAALRAHEVAMRDGTVPEQRKAYDELVRLQRTRKLGASAALDTLLGTDAETITP